MFQITIKVFLINLFKKNDQLLDDFMRPATIKI